MAGHPAYEGGWGRPRQAHYLLQLVYIYSFRVKGHHNVEVSMSKSMGVGGWGGKRHTQGEDEEDAGRKTVSELRYKATLARL